MRYLIRSLLLCGLMLSGCDLFSKDHHGAVVMSPSGKHSVFATVNRTDQNRPDYAYVVIHLADTTSNELHVYRSRAGNANKWALGWMPNEDIVILQSSDVGSMAFQIENDSLVEISPISGEMAIRAEILKAEKY